MPNLPAIPAGNVKSGILSHIYIVPDKKHSVLTAQTHGIYFADKVPARQSYGVLL